MCDCPGCTFERLAFSSLDDFLEDAEEAGVSKERSLLLLAILTGRQKGRIGSMMREVGLGLQPDHLQRAIEIGNGKGYDDHRRLVEELPAVDECFTFQVAPPGGIQ